MLATASGEAAAVAGVGFEDPERARQNLRLLWEGPALVADPAAVRIALRTLLPATLDALRTVPDPDAALDALERAGGVLWRYANADGSVAGPDDPGNPNGSLRGIAGVRNAAGNVAGLMPHPETASEAILGSDDGLGIIRSFVVSAAEWAATGSMAGAGSRAGADPVPAGAAR